MQDETNCIVVNSFSLNPCRESSKMLFSLLFAIQDGYAYMGYAVFVFFTWVMWFCCCMHIVYHVFSSVYIDSPVLFISAFIPCDCSCAAFFNSFCVLALSCH